MFFYADASGLVWCTDRSKSLTSLTGVNMEGGIDTKRVFQKAIAPFHNPGCSMAFIGLQFMVLETTK